MGEVHFGSRAYVLPCSKWGTTLGYCNAISEERREDGRWVVTFERNMPESPTFKMILNAGTGKDVNGYLAGWE